MGGCDAWTRWLAANRWAGSSRLPATRLGVVIVVMTLGERAQALTKARSDQRIGCQLPHGLVGQSPREQLERFDEAAKIGPCGTRTSDTPKLTCEEFYGLPARERRQSVGDDDETAIVVGVSFEQTEQKDTCFRSAGVAHRLQQATSVSKLLAIRGQGLAKNAVDGVDRQVDALWREPGRKNSPRVRCHALRRPNSAAWVPARRRPRRGSRPAVQAARTYSDFFSQCASSPTMPRRKASTQTTKIRPCTIVTQAPSWAR